MQSRRPLLVIVSGAPATGKTTLARRLATDLSLPLIEKDRLKERLAEELGSPHDVHGSQRFGRAAYAMLFFAARQVLDANIGAIVESNFRRGIAEPELARLLAGSDPRLIHCTATPGTIGGRYRSRFERGERHPVHLDAERGEALAHDLERGMFEPLDLDCPRLIVEVEGSYRPRYDLIVDFLRDRSA